MRGWNGAGVLLRDLRYSVRVLGRDRPFTLAAILTLALGIGPTTAIFCILYNLLLRPLPYPQADRLVQVESYVTTDQRGPRRTSLSAESYRSFAAQARSLEACAAYGRESFTLTGTGPAERISGEIVSGNYFGLLGVGTDRGRMLAESDDGTAVAAISERLWRSRFAARSPIAGTSLRLNGVALTIVGVAPDGFNGETGKADVWISSATAATEFKTIDGLLEAIVARLRPGVTLGEADAEARTLLSAAPRPGVQNTGRLVALGASKRDPQLTSAVVLMFGAVCCVALIACGNAASLLLARGIARRREIAIRRSLGATRAAIARQVVTESLLVSLLAAAVGLLLGIWALRGLSILRPVAGTNSWPTFTRALDADAFNLPPAVALFSLFAAAVTALLSGLGPALRLSRHELREDLSSEHTSASPGTAGTWRALVAAQIAVVLALLTGAALLTRSFERLLERPLGIDPRGVLTFRVNLPYDRYDEGHAAAFFAALHDRLARLPQIDGVARLRHLPVIERGTVTMLVVPGQAGTERIGYNAVEPEFFRIFGTRLVSGRLFDAHDRSSGVPAAVLTESAARNIFGNQDPLGRRLTANRVEVEVVGVIGDVYYEPQRPQLSIVGDIFVNARQGSIVAVHTDADPASLQPTLRTVVAEIDPELALFEVATLGDRVRSVQAYARFTTWITSVAAGLALFIALMGIYASVSYAATSRQREIAIRMALGARRDQVVRRFVREGLTICAAGVASGVPLAVATAYGLRALLYETAPGDPVALTAAAAMLALTAVVACVVPALRGTGNDPSLALRL